ncbi:MAG: hypothetical protein M3R07_05030 [Gemmatimonadota bacterium]|nr:hypothetical protein [Gemmatimonadota bacterium]
MTEKRIIAIAGATGAQGGGLARAILADTTSDFAVRSASRFFGRTSRRISKARRTGDEMAAKMSQALGQQVVFNAVSADAFRAFGFPGAQDLGNMFQFYDEFDEVVNASRNVEKSRALNPELQSFDQWLDRNTKSIPLQ